MTEKVFPTDQDAKTTLAVGDLFLISDSADSYKTKKVTLANFTTLQNVFNKDDAIVIADGAATKLSITNNDTTTNNNTLAIENDGTGNGLYINQDGNGISLNIDGENTTEIGINVQCDALTTGSAAHFKSNSTSTGTRNIVYIQNDNTAATGTTCLTIAQDAAQIGILIDQNGNEKALHIDTECTTSNGLNIQADALTTGKALCVYSNSSDSSARYLTQIINDNTSATGAIPLAIQQDGTGNGLYINQDGNGISLNIDTEATSAKGIQIYSSTSHAQDSMFSGYDGNLQYTAINRGYGTQGLSVYRNLASANTTTRMVDIVNDNSGDDQETLRIQNDAPSVGLFIDQNGNGIALNIDSESTTVNVLAIDATTTTSQTANIVSNSLTTGNGLWVYSISATFSGILSRVTAANAGNTGTAMAIEQASTTTGSGLTVGNLGTGIGLFINQDGNGKALDIDTEATTADAINVQCDTITTGVVARLASDSATTNTRNLVEIINDNSAAVGTTPLMIQQDAVTDTKFKKLRNAGGITFWVSTDQTAANGNLTGTEGDICFNSSATGQISYCTADGTTRTAL